MDKAILMLDDRLTDYATKVMLQNVIKRKKAYEEFKRRHFWTTLAMLVLSLLFIVYVYITFVKPYSYSFFDMFMRFISQSSSLFYSLVVFGTYGYMLILKKKMDKAEKEFHALRCEIVDRSKDLWKHEEAWKERHKIFKVLKDNYEINLYHENK